MESEYNFGIKNYRPSFYHSSQDFIKNNRKLFDFLKEKPIKSILAVWSIEDQDFLLEAPIVLKFETFNLELCGEMINSFSITTDTFDLNSKINWYGNDRFIWKEYHNFNSGFRIKKIKVIELEGEISNVSGNPGFNSKSWILGGIQFLNDSDTIYVYSIFDFNSIELSSIQELEDEKIRTIDAN